MDKLLSQLIFFFLTLYKKKEKEKDYSCIQMRETVGFFFLLFCILFLFVCLVSAGTSRRKALMGQTVLMWVPYILSHDLNKETDIRRYALPSLVTSFFFFSPSSFQ